MAAIPIERVEEIFDVTNHTPNVHADFHTAMYGILILKEATNVKLIAHERLRFNSALDRRLMEKYQEMQKYTEHIERLKTVSPQNSEILDKILKLANDQNRNETMESLTRYDNVLEFAANFYPKAVTKFFEMGFLKLEKIVHNPLANHTLRRTYHPKLDYFFGIDIKVPIKYQVGRLRDVERLQDIPHALQGEIAGLNTKFKVSLDPTRINNKSIRLMCHLEEDLLPDVPPIYIDIPEKYPFCSPTCVEMQLDYSLTPFFISVQNILTEFIFKLPKCYSVTHILNSWEMSIRKACYFDNLNVNSFSMIYEMLIQ